MDDETLTGLIRPSQSSIAAWYFCLFVSSGNARSSTYTDSGSVSRM